MDAYINVVGGLKISETSCDLAILAAVYSALKDTPIRPNTIILGEIGLTGEVRPIVDIERRLIEASRLGFTSCILPGGNKPGLDRTLRNKTLNKDNLSSFPELIYTYTLSEAMDVLFAEQTKSSLKRSRQ